MLVTFWRFPFEHKLLFKLLVLHPDGKTRDTFSIFYHTMIFTAVIHCVHAPVQTDCLEPHLVDTEHVLQKNLSLDIQSNPVNTDNAGTTSDG